MNLAMSLMKCEVNRKRALQKGKRGRYVWEECMAVAIRYHRAYETITTTNAENIKTTSKHITHTSSFSASPLFSCMSTMHFNWMTSMTVFRCILFSGLSYVHVSVVRRSVSVLCTIFSSSVWSLQCEAHLLLILSLHEAVWNCYKFTLKRREEDYG